MSAAMERRGPLRWRETGAGPAARPARSPPIPRRGATSSSAARTRRPAITSRSSIDDALQGVTHVVRGQDLFWSTSVHRLLQELLGLARAGLSPSPAGAGRDGRKLSKSTQATGLRELRAQGMTPDRYPQAGWACLSGFPRSGDSRAVAVIQGRRRESGAEDGEERKPRRRAGPKPRAHARAAARPARPARARRSRPRYADAADRHARVVRTLAASDLPERERGWATAIKDAAGHLARLTTLVVDAVKAGTGKLILQPKPFALRDFVDAAAQSLEARAEPSRLDVEISIAGDLPDRVSADAVRLRSALENLIDNAVKFTERGQRVARPSHRKPPAARRLKLTFTVADTGIGIVAADLKRLFRPFAQANKNVAQRFGGSGLGLSFARRIAEAMGGSLTVKSSPGQGSTFRLVVMVGPAPPEKKAANASADALAGLHVLCVEDNPYGRVVLNTVLGELGHQVSFAETGEMAVAAVARGGYDAVLMDVALPGSTDSRPRAASACCRGRPAPYRSSACPVAPARKTRRRPSRPE